MSESRDPSPSPRAAPAAVPRRRRWRGRGLIAAGIVALLAGAGAGWFGSGDDGTTAGAGPPDGAGSAMRGERGERSGGDVANSNDGVVAGGAVTPAGSGPTGSDSGGGAAGRSENTGDPNGANGATAALAGHAPGEPGPESAPSRGDSSIGAPAGGHGQGPGQSPGAGTASGTVPGAPPGAAPGGEFDPDRFASLLALAANRMTTDRFAAAESCLADLAGFALSAPQQAVVAQANVALQKRVQTVCDEVFTAAQSGEVLAAAQRVEDAWRDGAGQFRAALAARFEPFGIGRFGETVDLTVVPTPHPLAGDRDVRAGLGEDRIRGRVADAGARRVTLRVATARGLRFPTVALVDCEPVGVSPAEAADLGFAALHAGRPLLARLWLLAARSAAKAASGTDSPDAGERLARLAELFR